MKCPIYNVDLLVGQRLTVQIDYYPKCRGIWLEKDKLDKFVEKSGSVINSQEKNRHRNDHDESGIRRFLGGIFN